jgi:hypothetical protein
MALVTVARFVDPPSAHLARGLLEANGIDAFVFNEHYVGMDWLHSQAIGGVELRVAAEDAEQARALIENPPSAPETIFAADEDRREGDCPRCGAAEVRRDRLDHRLRALSLGLGVPLAAGGFRFRCVRCGEVWRHRPSHRGLRARLVDGVVLAVALVRFLVRWPVRILEARGIVPRRERAECWACGTAVEPTARCCPGCGVPNPPVVAFERAIQMGRDYDALCEACHTPWVRADYETLGGRCPVCGSKLPSDADRRAGLV